MKPLRYLCFVAGLIALSITLITCDWQKEGDVLDGNDMRVVRASLVYKSIVTDKEEIPKKVTVVIGDKRHTYTFDKAEVSISYASNQKDDIYFECTESYGTDTFTYKTRRVVNESRNFGTTVLEWSTTQPVIRARVMTSDGVPLPNFTVCLFPNPNTTTSCDGALASKQSNQQGYALFTGVEADKTYGLRTEGRINNQNYYATGSIALPEFSDDPSPLDLRVSQVQTVQTQKLVGTVAFTNLVTNRNNDIPTGATVTLKPLGMPSTQTPQVYTTTVAANGAFELTVPYSTNRMQLTIEHVQPINNEKIMYSLTQTITGPNSEFRDLTLPSQNPLSLPFLRATTGFVPIEVRTQSSRILLPSFNVCVYPDEASAQRAVNCTGALFEQVQTNARGYVLIMGLEASKTYTFKAWGKSAADTLRGRNPYAASSIPPPSSRIIGVQ
ncbi:hypothetical protein [Runella zeae]|uniref:hypothetical protein n=1 Tax=Runella zeae TaxID=94255 RepID=UPI0023535CEF|nr:hypothetical protein [Runella zeae]